MTGKQFASVLGIVLLLLVLGGIYSVVRPNEAHGGGSAPSSITVLGSGSVQTSPDRARFSFGVTTERKTAAAASSATALRIRRVANALLKEGVDSKDIQTEGIWISPHYDAGSFDGYDASNAVVANIRNLDSAGSVIDAATAAGATMVYGPALFRSDRQSLARAALRAAVADARAKAEGIAASTGQSVGRVVSVVEGGAVPPSGAGATTTTGGTTTGTTTTGSIPMPIYPGQQSVDATVSVTFTAS